MPSYFSISELAREYACRPRDISDLFYLRLLPDDLCPVKGGRRLIPAELAPLVREKVTERLRRREERHNRAETASA